MSYQKQIGHVDENEKIQDYTDNHNRHSKPEKNYFQLRLIYTTKSRKSNNKDIFWNVKTLINSQIPLLRRLPEDVL